MIPRTPADRLRLAIATGADDAPMALALAIASFRAEPLGSRFSRGVVHTTQRRLRLHPSDARDHACAALQGGRRDEGAFA